ncbi:hypothetical protein BGW36DRAFT_422142 [Talaromyces proteolyticus]|uniref:Ankyrin repeat protein n=1 Tax=Talaromyces proteolyticus TaxID=1131652 RepID=A0AAD4L444_9EURO|nr:uncharacterized protein BGW36DRAFT_422142 [Talaromyces proteolyticus]KAH8705592.1 hypothetical protein BGW36DRAFT_422142 [Talaromyces proteolyticus]
MLPLKTGHLEVVWVLLEHGAGVNAPDKMDGTAVLGASQSGDFEVVTFLLRNGVNQFAHALLITFEYGNLEVVKVFLKQKKNSIQIFLYDNALRAASSKGLHKIQQLLLEIILNFSIQSDKHGNGNPLRGSDGRNPKRQGLADKSTSSILVMEDLYRLTFMHSFHQTHPQWSGF